MIAFRLLVTVSLLVSTGCSGGGSSDADADRDAGDADRGPGDGGDAETDADGDGGLEQQSGLEIEITTGRVRGTEDRGLRVFKGIPFAEPPVADLRFRQPVPVLPWDGTLEADDYGPSCPQQSFGPEFIVGDFGGPQSEDCLFLNVWAYDDGRLRPVMVFFYGGGFVVGAASWPLYDGAELAREGDVVVVTVNYRLGALGYLATAALADEGGGSAGNYGLADQVEALRWVRRNIVAFGGDPANVTVFGESAGAISVCALFGVPAADGLYHRAIMESGMCALATLDDPSALGMRPGLETGAALVDALGCGAAEDEVACLRGLPVADLVAASSISELLGGSLAEVDLPFPVVDGVFLVDEPLDRVGRGEVDVPFVAGSNEVEGLLFAGTDLILTRADLEAKIASYVGDAALAAEVAALYPASDYPLPRDAFVAFLGDATFVCPSLAAATVASAGEPSFAYHFTRTPLLARPVGAIHSMELMYVFGTFDAFGIVPTAADARVRDMMQRAWGGFARDGAPPLEVGWPAYDAADPSIAILDDPPSITDEIANGRCEALSALGLPL